jgi:hypothetical protein
MKSYNERSKIIAVIREPVSRIKSHYLMDIRSGVVADSLDELLVGNNKYAEEYIGASKYLDNINNYIDVFGEKNVLVIDFDDYVNKNDEVVLRVLNFLSLEVSELPQEKKNGYRMPRGVFKLVYKYPWVRKLYNFLFSSSIKKILKPVILSNDKPEGVFFTNDKLVDELTIDYRRALDAYIKR